MIGYQDGQTALRLHALQPTKWNTLYWGVTSDLIERVYQHRMEMVKGFTKRYGIHYLVWYEVHEMMENAILGEKQLKKWRELQKSA